MKQIVEENLFRKQAIESLSRKQPGRPIGVVPRPWLWLNILTLLLFSAMAVTAMSLEYSRKETVRGWLIARAGVARISSGVAATVSKISREPGDWVRKGDPLIYLSTDSSLSDGSSKSQELIDKLRQESLEIDKQLALSLEQQGLERQSLDDQLENMAVEIAAIDSLADAQRHRISLGSEKLSRLEIAVADGAVTDWDVLKQKEELGVLRQDMSRLKQETASRHRERELLVGNQGRSPVRAEIERSTMRARRLRLSQMIAEHESTRMVVLKAPVSGTVASVQVNEGSFAPSQQLLMTILPQQSSLAAEVFVPSRAVGFIRPGQSVLLTYDAFPQQKFGAFEGTVKRVSEFVLLPSEIPQTFPIREATYKVQIDIGSALVETNIGPTRLRPGMLLAAEMILEKRNLFDWLMEPLRTRRTDT